MHTGSITGESAIKNHIKPIQASLDLLALGVSISISIVRKWLQLSDLGYIFFERQNIGEAIRIAIDPANNQRSRAADRRSPGG